MRRFWLVLLSVGLVLVFSASAMAVDVKFSGEFYAAGMYLDRTKLNKTYYDGGSGEGPGAPGPSTAFYFQRLRVQTDFIVSPGLKLITRFDAMERAWGAPRSSYSAPPTNPYGIPYYSLRDSAGTDAENENIAFDWAYVQYASPIGTFNVGYQNDGAWGTVFGDSSVPQGKIAWSIQIGAWTALAQIVKDTELSQTAKRTGVNATDLDTDKYIVAALYNWKGGEAGLLYSYQRDANWRQTGGFISTNSLQPYAKAQIGPVKVQAELDYYWGEIKGEDAFTGMSIKLEAINFFLDAVADFKMFYVGGTFAYLSGDDPGTTDKFEDASGIRPAVGGGIDWNPCLIMFNYDLITKWVGSVPGYSGSQVGGPMTNAWFGQGRVGIRPIPALDIMASVSYAQADKKPAPYLFYPTYANNKYGWEVDITGTYKITNNLSYMLGIGYLFTGDYYKGFDYAGQNFDLRDNYMLINKLTLTF